MRATLTLLLIAAFITVGCKVSKPGTVESGMMRQVKKKVTIGGKSDKNPLPDVAANVKEGQEHFGHHCQICHGLDGQNTGVPFAQQMSPPVADLKSPDVQGYTDGQLHWILQNGISPSGMPSWNGILDEDEMWKIVLYMRHLPEKGSLGEPAVFTEEKEEHQAIESGSGHHHHHSGDQGQH